MFNMSTEDESSEVLSFVESFDCSDFESRVDFEPEVDLEFVVALEETDFESLVDLEAILEEAEEPFCVFGLLPNAAEI